MPKKAMAVLAVILGILSAQIAMATATEEGMYADDFDTNADCVENSDSYVCPDDCWYYDKVSAGYYYCEGTNNYYYYEFDYEPGAFEYDFYESEMCEDYFDSYYGMYYSCVDGCNYYDSYQYGFYMCADDWEQVYYAYFDYPEEYFEYTYKQDVDCSYEYNEEDALYYYYCPDGCWYYEDTKYYYCEESDDIYFYDGAFQSDYETNEICTLYSDAYHCPDDCWYYDPAVFNYYFCLDSYKYYEYGGANGATIYGDVPGDHKYATAINFLSFNEVLEGYADGDYKPGNAVNRVEALKIIFATLDNVLDSYELDTEDTSLGSLTFSDVEGGSWYMPYLRTAFDLGIVQGYEDGTYKPAQTVNKVEILKIIIEAFDLEDELVEEVTEDLFPDVDNTQWYAKYVLVAYSKGVFVDMDSDENFEPSGEMTRGEVADFVFKFVEAVTK